MRTVQMSNYTVGNDCFDELPSLLQAYRATQVVLVGGTRALAAAAPLIKNALSNSSIHITGELVYGRDSTHENVDTLVANIAFRQADIAFAIGGGKAIDTVKTAAKQLNKTVFSVPTICSNCSAATAIAVLYNNDGSLSGYAYPDAPAHIFINPSIIAHAPVEYFWAGIGDALSKQPEVEYATAKAQLDHTATLGRALAHTCSEPLFTYAQQGLEEVCCKQAGEAVERIALDIVINTGYVSNLTNQPDYYYNSSIAHAFYNATTGIERPGHVLHGAVVSFGVLVLFAYTQNTAELKRYAALNSKLGLPTTLSELNLTPEHLTRIAELAQQTNEWRRAVSEPLDAERFIQAILDADAYGQTLAQ